MFIEGQQVTTKYGAGKVLLVSKAKPLVYVRVDGRNGGIYIFSESEVVLADVGNRPVQVQISQASTVEAEKITVHQPEVGSGIS